MEYLDVFNDGGVCTGFAERKLIHQLGLWHKTFQCWFGFKSDGIIYILFQRRCNLKLTYPNYFDITAAGHVSFGETVTDGIREVNEELGVSIDFKDLKHIGTLTQIMIESNFKDYEICDTYFYNCNLPMDSFILQKEEVSGLFKINLADILALFRNEKVTISASGFDIGTEQITREITLNIDDFVPHGKDYYFTVFKFISEYFLV